MFNQSINLQSDGVACLTDKISLTTACILVVADLLQLLFDGQSPGDDGTSDGILDQLDARVERLFRQHFRRMLAKSKEGKDEHKMLKEMLCYNVIYIYVSI